MAVLKHFILNFEDKNIFFSFIKKIIMEIGQKVKWQIDEKNYEGLFMQITNNGKAEVICYLMNDVNCHLRVFVEPNLLK
jgi:hypothetical protein